MIIVRLRRDCGTLRRYIGSYATRLKGVHYGPGLVVRGTHRLSLEPDAAAARVRRPLADRIYAAPHVFFGSEVAPTAATPMAGAQSASARSSALGMSLPPNVNLMTLHALSEHTVLLRLSHQFGVGEDANLSLPTRVSIRDLFATWNVTDIREVSLTNNQDKADLRRRRAASTWQTPSPDAAHAWRAERPYDYRASSAVTLGPMEIKTFVLTHDTRRALRAE